MRVRTLCWAPWAAFGSTKPHGCLKFQHQNQQTGKLNHKILTFCLQSAWLPWWTSGRAINQQKGEARPDGQRRDTMRKAFLAGHKLTSLAALALIATAAPAVAGVPES